MWANVAKSLNCLIAMVDRLLEKDNISNAKEGENEPSAADCKVLHTGGKQPSLIFKKNNLQGYVKIYTAAEKSPRVDSIVSLMRVLIAMFCTLVGRLFIKVQLYWVLRLLAMLAVVCARV